MPRSGHSLVSYGDYVILFGGINYQEEISYNDFYLLDTNTWKWSYIGERGVEISGRNSFSFFILSQNTPNSNEEVNILVIFGGASPELGPLNEMYYSILPPKNLIDAESFYLDWQSVSTKESPCPREMHSGASLLNYFLMSGGRVESGDLLDDIWLLTLNLDELVEKKEPNEDLEPQSTENDSLVTPLFEYNKKINSNYSINFDWKKLDTKLAFPICSHTSYITVNNTNKKLAKLEIGIKEFLEQNEEISIDSLEKIVNNLNKVKELFPKSYDNFLYCIYGGFCSSGIFDKVLTISLGLYEEKNSINVNKLNLTIKLDKKNNIKEIENTKISNRFGHSLTSISVDFLYNIVNNNRYKILFNNKNYNNIIKHYNSFNNDSTEDNVYIQILNKLKVISNNQIEDVNNFIKQLQFIINYININKNYLGILLYGGVNMEEDLCDLWIIFN